MKKQTKKLVLAKETLRNLERGELGRVAGEGSVYECTESVCCSGDPSCYGTCLTCACPSGGTGGTRYC